MFGVCVCVLCSTACVVRYAGASALFDSCEVHVASCSRTKTYGCNVQVPTCFWACSVFAFTLHVQVFSNMQDHTYRSTQNRVCLFFPRDSSCVDPAQRCSPWTPWASCCSFSFSLHPLICICLSLTSQHICFTPFSLL